MRRPGPWGLFLLLVGLAACQQLAALAPAGGAAGPIAGSTNNEAGLDWASLERRPIVLPAVAPGAPCPHAAARQVDPADGPAVGAGPGYAVGLDHGVRSGGATRPGAPRRRYPK